jgi:transcriptional regulator with XRE-family HTH domain
MHYAVSSTMFRALPTTMSAPSVRHEGWRPPSLRVVISDTERKSRLAYAIRHARERRGMTPPQLAEAVGRGRGTVNDWEAGKSAPSLLDLGPLCAALKVDPRLFADLPEEPASPVDDYLIQVASEGVQEGLRRAKRPRLVKPDDEQPPP